VISEKGLVLRPYNLGFDGGKTARLLKGAKRMRCVMIWQLSASEYEYVWSDDDDVVLCAVLGLRA